MGVPGRSAGNRVQHGSREGSDGEPRIGGGGRKIEGLPRVTLKGLRHTHATLLLELGEHPKVVQERLGHSTITTTINIYSHVTPTTMQKSAIDRIAAHLGDDVAGA